MPPALLLRLLLAVSAAAASEPGTALAPATGDATLAIVFDVTGSMWDDLVQVTDGASRILARSLSHGSRAIANYALVPFHDPGSAPRGALPRPTRRPPRPAVAPARPGLRGGGAPSQHCAPDPGTRAGPTSPRPPLGPAVPLPAPRQVRRLTDGELGGRCAQVLRSHLLAVRLGQVTPPSRDSLSAVVRWGENCPPQQLRR